MNILTLPPGPRGHFLSGSLPAIRKDRVQFLVDLQRDYGDIAHIRLGPFDAVVVFHPEAIKHILQDNWQNYSKKTRTYATLSNSVGNGLIVSDGDFWLTQRRLMAPAFHRTRIQALAGMFVEETEDALEHWAKVFTPEKSVNITQELMHLALAIVTRALFGKRIADPEGTIFKALSIMLNDPPFRFEHPFSAPLWVPTTYNRRFREARAYVDQIVYDLIEERRARPDAGGDLLAMLMEAAFESDTLEPIRMSDLQLRDELFTLLLGGHESTALSLGWTLYLLSQHPEVEARLRAEVTEVLGERPPTLEDLSDLSYTRMVLDESIRLFPPAWLFERRAIADDEVMGFRVPAGMNLGFTPYVTHRLPEFWENPDVFDPEHMSSERMEQRPRFAYMPFGGGPRQCIGNAFALQEMHLILPILLQHYRFRLDPAYTVQREPVVSLRPKDGLHMYLEPV